MKKNNSVFYRERFDLAVREFHFFLTLASKAETTRERLGLRAEAFRAFRRGREAIAGFRAGLRE